MLESFRDVTANQSRTLEQMYGVQEKSTRILAKFELPTQQTTKTEKVEILPELLNLSKQKEIELLEKALISIACHAAKEQHSFLAWVKKYHPLSHPADFVNETHEFLRRQVGKLVGDEHPNTPFSNLVKRAKDEKLIYCDEHVTANKPYPITVLYDLNDHRNFVIHPPINSSQWEKWSRSVLYLMNLALVWSKIVIEAEDCHE